MYTRPALLNGSNCFGKAYQQGWTGLRKSIAKASDPKRLLPQPRKVNAVIDLLDDLEKPQHFRLDVVFCSHRFRPVPNDRLILRFDVTLGVQIIHEIRAQGPEVNHLVGRNVGVDKTAPPVAHGSDISVHAEVGVRPELEWIRRVRVARFQLLPVFF